MHEQQELQPIINVKECETNPKKFCEFLEKLRFFVNFTFDDGTHIYESIRQNMLSSMTTEDIAQYNYQEFLNQQMKDKIWEKRDRKLRGRKK
jgi:hypothetical protein